MKDQLISFKTAKLAKEKGFVDVPFDYLNKNKKSKVAFTRCCTYSDDNRNPQRRKFYSEKNPHYLAPTQSLLQKWLREEHEIDVSINSLHYCSTDSIREDGVMINYGYSLQIVKDQENGARDSGYFTYEEALEVGLQEALKLIKQ